jgi:hypothetical protein
MKTLFAITGAFILFLSLMGALGFGNFVLMYSPDKITCTKEKEK